MKNIFLIVACIMLASFTPSKATSNSDAAKKTETDISVVNNPMSSKLSISMACHVCIVNDANVKVIEQQSCNMVDISPLDIGVYNVQLSNEKGKLLKQVTLVVE